MKMTKKEAIAQIEKLKSYCEYMEDSDENGAYVFDLDVQALDFALSALRSIANEPLTLEELRKMDGEPVWVEEVKHWALIDIEKGGQWDGIPFAVWKENGAEFTYNIKDRKLHCYRRPPNEDGKDKNVPINEPLMLEKLENMEDTTPVWWDQINSWVLVYKGNLTTWSGKHLYAKSCNGKFYRRPPEEVLKDG